MIIPVRSMRALEFSADLFDCLSSFSVGRTGLFGSTGVTSGELCNLKKNTTLNLLKPYNQRLKSNNSINI